MSSIPWNIGSVVVEVSKYVENIPTALSGTNMDHTVYASIDFVEKYTGQTIGSTNINLKYHNAITYKTAADVLYSMNLTGGDSVMTKLGDFTTKNGGTDKNVLTSANKWNDALKDELSILGRRFNYFKANS